MASRLEPVGEDPRELGVVPFEHNSRGGVDSVGEAVNAADVSGEALERVRRRADDVGIDIEWSRADLMDPGFGLATGGAQPSPDFPEPRSQAGRRSLRSTDRPDRLETEPQPGRSMREPKPRRGDEQRRLEEADRRQRQLDQHFEDRMRRLRRRLWNHWPQQKLKPLNSAAEAVYRVARQVGEIPECERGREITAIGGRCEPVESDQERGRDEQRVSERAATGERAEIPRQRLIDEVGELRAHGEREDGGPLGDPFSPLRMSAGSRVEQIPDGGVTPRKHYPFVVGAR